MSGPAISRPRPGRTSIALDNLRAYVILLVLAFHSSLAYLAFLPAQPFAFNSPPFEWRAFPIIDIHRSTALELFCAWQDVFLMTLFFFLSGLFVWPSLKRKGIPAFVADRIKRLGIPFALVVALLMPVALYPVYVQTATEPEIAAYVGHFLALPWWPCGPMWFLWLLLSADLIAAGLHKISPDWGERLARFSSLAGTRPVRYFAWLLAASALAYVPLALVFTPEAWAQFGPFAFELSCPVHYAVYFLSAPGWRLRHRSRAIRIGRIADQTLAAVAWRCARVLCTVAGINGTNNQGAGPISIGSSDRRRSEFCDCLSMQLLWRAGIGAALGGEPAGVARQPQAKCLRYVPGALPVCGLAAIRTVAGRDARHRQGRHRFHGYALVELDDNRRLPASAVAHGTITEVAGSRRSRRDRHLLRDKAADTLYRAPRLRHHRGEQMPYVRHPRPNFEHDLAAGGSHAIRHARGVVAQHLIAADLDQGRRQAARIAVERRSVGVTRVDAREITLGDRRNAVGIQKRVGNCVPPKRGTGQCQIGPG